MRSGRWRRMRPGGRGPIRPPACHASSASAAASTACTTSAGSSRSASSSGCRSRCSRSSVSRSSRANRRAPSPKPPGSLWLPGVARLVEHGDGQLAVVAPGAPVEVGAAHARPRVVDDGDLGVHVHRRALVVLEVVHVYPIRVPPSRTPRSPAAGPPRWAAARSRPSTSGWRGTTTTRCSSGLRRSAVGEQPGDVRRPHVLVLEVDQPPRPSEGLRERRAPPTARRRGANG